MQEFFRELFEYTHHFNQQGIDLLAGLGDRLPARCAHLQSHVLNAHQIWNNRIVSKRKQFGVWDIHPPGAWRGINEDNYQETLSILSDFQPGEVIQYKTSKGDAFKSTARDILFHIVNHSTYHRGQIAMILRQHDIDPIASDYVHFKR